MNYRHGYHAGGFADVFKHIILIRLLKALLSKEKPFCYLDTHAGAGKYAFASEFMQKGKESEGGIVKLFNLLGSDTPFIIQEYLELISNIDYPEYYPGSPLIAQTLLRRMDRGILVELHPEEYKTLKENFKEDKRIAVHHQDGYEALKAFLPPKERRGLILIDPAFEKNSEWDLIMQGLRDALTKFATGIYAIWYPIKDPKIVQKFIHAITELHLPNLIKTEFSLYPSDTALTLSGCGMLIINAPWQFAEELQTWLPWLWQVLSIEKKGYYSIE